MASEGDQWHLGQQGQGLSAHRWNSEFTDRILSLIEEGFGCGVLGDLLAGRPRHQWQLGHAVLVLLARHLDGQAPHPSACESAQPLVVVASGVEAIPTLQRCRGEPSPCLCCLVHR